MRIALAMLLDAYRELNARKLFWITLVMSGMVVLSYGSIGFNESGMSMFYGLQQIDSEYLRKGSLMSEVLYRSIFSWIMVGLWLAWTATILALISTTTIFPDFMAGGSIDLVLSKPIRRTTLFAAKYMVSLLFVVLQVSLFSLGTFLCLGMRLDDWDWKIFAAIPIVTVFYSYLFSVNVLLGVWTRSALAALLVTMLLWSSLFGITLAEGLMYKERTKMVIQTERSDRLIADLEAHLATSDRDESRRARLMVEVADARSLRDTQNEAIDKMDRLHRPIRVIQSVLPKTGETINMLDRLLKRDTDVNILDIFSGNVVPDQSGGFRTTNTSQDREVQRRMEAEVNRRSVWYVVGTSLVFEVVILSIACLIFVRRDF